MRLGGVRSGRTEENRSAGEDAVERQAKRKRARAAGNESDGQHDFKLPPFGNWERRAVIRQLSPRFLPPFQRYLD